ncbi:hypothetical protein WCD74_27740 [Actinomycetospora sp. OC33-EN08]|uniref:Lipoprotein n=1 Tax=Actinomycetospora aurantiaca TaxID=3129233 RepID=A0ABU8MYU6_9PSEU
MKRLAALVAVLTIAGCAPDVERTEVVRVPSPDGALDAVVVQTSAGASTPFGYLVTVPPHGCAAADEPVLRVVGASRSASAAGVTVAWVGPRTVRVGWLDARFRDPDADVVTLDGPEGPVSVVSGAGASDATAPPGGMPPSTGPVEDC